MLRRFVEKKSRISSIAQEKTPCHIQVDDDNPSPNKTHETFKILDVLGIRGPPDFMYWMQRLQKLVEEDTSCKMFSGLFQNSVSSLNTVLDCMNQLLDITDDLLKLGDPSHDRYRYPADRHRMKTHVGAIGNVETKRDIFWRAIDCVRQKTHSALYSAAT